MDYRMRSTHGRGAEGRPRGERAVHCVPQQGGVPMRRSVRWTLFASAMSALALFVAACGGSNNNGSSSTSSSSGGTQTKVAAGKPGGPPTYLASGDVQNPDPGPTDYT